MAGAGYPAGARSIQTLLGVGDSASRNARALRDDIPEVAAEFLAAQVQVMTSYVDGAGQVWASLLSGQPGFTSAVSDRQVEIAADPLPGDPLNDLVDGDRLGVLGVEPETRRRMRANGRARRRTGGGFVVDVDQVVSNCKRYISKRQHHRAPGMGAPARGDLQTSLSASQQAWIRGTDTFFIATADSEGADISHRGGNPGFVDVSDTRHLSWPDYAGNSMFLTLGHLRQNPHAGLLVIDWEQGSTLQLTGTTSVDFRPAAQHTVHFEIHAVSEVANATDLRWELQERSPANPPIPANPPKESD